MDQARRRGTTRPFATREQDDLLSEAQKAIDRLNEQLCEENEHTEDDKKHELLWKLMSKYIPATEGAVQVSFVNHIEYTLARSRFNFDDLSAYLSVSYSVRDRLIELSNDTNEFFKLKKPKAVYYVSIEFLIGRFLRNALLNLELESLYKDALSELGFSIDDLYGEEYDCGLGNGGLGRLAACFMDSMATKNLPAAGYGLMYSFGMFKQTIAADGSQCEIPDYWLAFGDPWRVQKSTVTYPVCFYGKIENGSWKHSLTIIAQANDFLIPGYATDNTLTLRLWSSKPTSELDEEKFRFGDYYEAIKMKQTCENLTSVLYPNDNSNEGREMSLMQEYFLSSASLQDIINRLKTKQNAHISDLSEYAAIQLNDTHPTLMVPELIRLLVDQENCSFQESVEIARKVFSYTCHTLMPEALEKWPVWLMQSVLPRHLEIIYLINQMFLDSVRHKLSDSEIRAVSIIEEGPTKMVRMANLAVIICNTVNGVSMIHTNLMKKHVFRIFFNLNPKKFINITNGVTVRRWVHHCNPGMSKLITGVTGNENWTLDANELTALLSVSDHVGFCEKWMNVKLSNKRRLADFIEKSLGIHLEPEIQMFDVQVKRIHEYKRQTLNIMGVIDRYLTILEATPEERQNIVPRAVIFGGKAAPGYYAAKKLVKLINNVAKKINSDEDVGDLLKLVFIPNYNVSMAELIIPATDLSQHISTAGTEASGTSNMKFAFNGSLIIGTHDGATIEIAEQIGEENVFFFGARAEEVESIRSQDNGKMNPRLARVFQTIRKGTFGEPGEYEAVLYPIENGDNYLVAHDFMSYLESQEMVDESYIDAYDWTRRTIVSTANMGYFSSDRTIMDYAEQVWKISPCPLPTFEDPVHTFSQQNVPITRINSIGSMRRHHLQSGVENQEETFTKGGFGSLRRHIKFSSDVKVKAVLSSDDDDKGLDIVI